MSKQALNCHLKCLHIQVFSNGTSVFFKGRSDVKHFLKKYHFGYLLFRFLENCFIHILHQVPSKRCFI